VQSYKNSASKNQELLFSCVRLYLGGGWAASKWRSYFGALGWRCGVSEVNTAKANFL